MKIIMLTGSPHKRGTTSLLADYFAKGCVATGNELIRFDVAFKNIHFCTGCEYCQRNRALCVQKDDMSELIPQILEADAVVFVTPLYSFGFASQIKVVIERFYPVMEQLKGRKKSALIAASYDNEPWTMNALVVHYQTILKYLGWQDVGMVLAVGCGARSDVEVTDYPHKAYLLGKKFS